MNARFGAALALAAVVAGSHTDGGFTELGESDRVRLEAVARIAGSARFLCVGVAPETSWQPPPAQAPIGVADASALLLQKFRLRGWNAEPNSSCTLSWAPRFDNEGSASNPIKIFVGPIWFAPSGRKAYVDVYTSAFRLEGERLGFFRPGKYGRRLYFQRAHGVWSSAEGDWLLM